MNGILVNFILLMIFCLQVIFDFIKEYKSFGWIESTRFFNNCSLCVSTMLLYIIGYKDVIVPFMWRS